MTNLEGARGTVAASKTELLQQLAKSRVEQGLSQESLAALVGCSRMTIQRAETASEGVSLSTFLALAKSLNLKVCLVSESAEP